MTMTFTEQQLRESLRRTTTDVPAAGDRVAQVERRVRRRRRRAMTTMATVAALAVLAVPITRAVLDRQRLDVAEQSASGSTASVESQAGSLVDIASPGDGWSRATVDDLTSTLVRTASEQAPIDAAPVVYIRDQDGTVTYALSGWSRTMPASGAASVCEQVQRWVAAAENSYGLVGAAGQVEGSCPPTAREAADGPSPVVAACAPAVPEKPSTCARVDAVRTPTGQVRMVATVAIQGQ